MDPISELIRVKYHFTVPLNKAVLEEAKKINASSFFPVCDLGYCR